MRRLAVGLILTGLLLGLAAGAHAAWVWRDGRWIYTDSTEPPLPAPEAPKEPAPPRPPIAPSPKPEEPEPPAPPPPKPETPAPKPETPAPKVETPAPKPEAPTPKVEPGPAKPPPEPFEPVPPTPAPPWWKWWQKAPSAGGDAVLFEDARADLAAGRRGSAAKALKTLIKDYPTSSRREEAMWLRAGALFDQKDHYKAYEQYEELLTQYAGSVHYRDALLKEIEIADLFFGPVRRRVLGMPLLSGDTEAVEILRRVYEHQPAGDLADDVVLKIADHYWSKSKWQEAEDYYDKYCREYPNGDAILHAELQRAKCAIERCRGPRYDVTSLKLAYDRLRQYRQKFPEAAEREGVPAMIQEVLDKQAEALYQIASRYRRGGKPLAAAFYAERLRERHPDSPWSEKAREFLADVPATGQVPAPEAGQQEPAQ